MATLQLFSIWSILSGTTAESNFAKFIKINNISASIFGTNAIYLENSGAATLKQQLDKTVPKECSAVHVYLLARLGTRYPDWPASSLEKNKNQEILKVLYDCRHLWFHSETTRQMFTFLPREIFCKEE